MLLILLRSCPFIRLYTSALKCLSSQYSDCSIPFVHDTSRHSTRGNEHLRQITIAIITMIIITKIITMITMIITIVTKIITIPRIITMIITIVTKIITIIITMIIIIHHLIDKVMISFSLIAIPNSESCRAPDKSFCYRQCDCYYLICISFIIEIVWPESCIHDNPNMNFMNYAHLTKTLHIWLW